MTPTGQPAYTYDGAAVGAEHFYAVACDPRRSVVVEACAGAGKTWMLVSRMLRALLDGCAPQDILAITFTKKAAGEMRERLQQWLTEFANADDAALTQALVTRGVRPRPDGTLEPQQLAALRALHGTLLASGRPVQIRTFHSWFATLVRHAPLAVLHHMGLPGGYELLEQNDRAVALVWRRFQARLVQDEGGRADYLAAVAEHGRFNTQKALAAALEKRTEFVLADVQGVVDASVLRFGQQFPEFSGLDEPRDALDAETARQILTQAARALGQRSGKKAKDAATALEQALAAGDAHALFAALFTKIGEPRKLGEGTGDQEVAAAYSLLERVRAAQHQHEAWLHHQRMARLTRGLIEDYDALKRERGWVDMNDLERAALALLSDPVLGGWVQERLDMQVRHLLIDEFQDTNPLQWQALHAWLSGYAGAAHAPSVFMVGDPKQSIYRFRRAEPQVFIAAKAFVREGLGGALLSCDHTRRNAHAIVGLVNAAMLQAQAAGHYEGYRAHTTASTDTGALYKLPAVARDAVPTAGMQMAAQAQSATGWRDSLTTPRLEAQESRKTMECRQAAQWITQALRTMVLPDGTPLQASDIMVLARKRESLVLMEQVLTDCHIAATQPEKIDLCDAPEVQDMVDVLDVLVSGLHDLSLARVLKSPLFSLGDDALVEIALRQRALQASAPEGVRVGWLDTLQSGGDLSAALQGVAATLLQWKQWVDRLPPHDALSSIYHHGDILARYASAANPAMRASVLANLQALLHAALDLDGGRYTTAYSLVRALRAGGVRAPVQADAVAVRLLTVHGAKGLEAPVVLLLDTNGQAKNAESMGVLVDWPGHVPHPLRFVFLASEANPSACAADLLAAERAARHREELNAMYVALTRCKNTLVLSTVEPKNANQDSWWQRLETQAQAISLAPDPGDGLLQSAAAAHAGAGSGLPALALQPAPAAPAATFAFKVLPMRDPARTLKVASTSSALGGEGQGLAMPLQSLESRVGQAMHRLLEWLPAKPGGYRAADALAAPALWSNPQCLQVGQEFVLDAAQVASACAMAVAMVAGQGAWCWDTQALRWQANEVPLTRAGRPLRIDRLVQDRAGLWWVLDYKSSSQPQQDPALCAQLQGYGAAVQAAYPGQGVRLAFLTPQGRLVEIPLEGVLP